MADLDYIIATVKKMFLRGLSQFSIVFWNTDIRLIVKRIIAALLSLHPKIQKWDAVEIRGIPDRVDISLKVSSAAGAIPRIIP